MIRNLPIRLKFIAIYLNMAIFTLPILLVSFLAMRSMSNDIDDLYQRHMATTEYAMRMEAQVQEEQLFFRDALLQDGDAAGLDSALSALDTAKKEFQGYYDQYAALVDTGHPESVAARDAAYSAYYTNYLPALDGYIDELRVGGGVDADASTARMAPLQAAVETSMDNAAQNGRNLAEAASASAKSAVSTFAWVYPVFLIVYIAVTYAIGRTLTKQIAFPAVKLAEAAKRIAVGDINVMIDHESGDEIGSLAVELKEMVASIQQQSDALETIADGDYTVDVPIRSEKDVMNRSIRLLVERNDKVLADIRDAASQVAGGAVQIADGAQTLATGASEQAATIEEFTAAITEVQSQADENNRVSTQTYQEAQEAGRLMDISMESVGRMTEAMHSITESSQNIAKVIKAIDDIAFQTNILSLNAAVEAARAGQHGKGFAVVADEVRNLAAKSAEAAKETADLIEDSVRCVQEGAIIAEKTSESMNEVAKIAANNAEGMRKLSLASERQSASIAEITEGITQISSVVQANSATAEQSAASAEEMSAQSTMLNEIVSGFRLRGQKPVQNDVQANQNSANATAFTMVDGMLEY